MKVLFCNIANMIYYHGVKPYDTRLMVEARMSTSTMMVLMSTILRKRKMAQCMGL